MLIDSYEIEMFSPPCDPGSPIWVARVKTNSDLGESLPYINASVRNAFYDPKTPTLVWREDAHKYALRQNVISINNLKDRDHAERVAKKIVDRINDIWERRENIEPDNTTRVPPKLLDILKLLPPHQLQGMRLSQLYGFCRPDCRGGKVLGGLPAPRR